MMLNSWHKLTIGSLFIALCVPVLRAQQGSQQQQPPQQNPSANQNQTPDQSAAPIPAYHSPLAGAAAQDQNGDESGNVEPDNRPLAGAQTLSLGSPETSRSYWQPHVSLVETGDSDALGPQAGWTSYSSVLGGIDVHKISGHSDLTLGYLGGGTFSNDGSLGNSVVQEVNFAEKLSARRLSVSFLDNMAYLPETAFGYGGTGAVGIGGIGSLPGGGALTLQPGLSPEGTILTTRGQQIDNAAIVEADVNLTPRSSVTLMGGYSLLRFFDTSLLNFDDVIAQVGYNHQLSRADSIALFYRFNQYSYNGLNQKIHDHVAQLSYARRLTGRLAFQMAAGPEYALFDTPVLTGGSAKTSGSELTWSLATSLTYGVKRGSLGLSYSHGVNGGSGVLSGSIADIVTGNVSRQLSRTTNFGINGGYARNSALAIPGFSTFNQNYNYWFGGANLNRPFGRSLTVFLSYQIQYQDSNVGFCLGANCSTSFTRHLISAGVNWQSRPMLF
jgi:hypothetical protein